VFVAGVVAEREPGVENGALERGFKRMMPLILASARRDGGWTYQQVYLPLYRIFPMGHPP
jgi:hypothetical protein